MKAAIFLGPGQMEVREIPAPVAEKGEVVIRVKACAICGTDLRTYRFGHKKVKPPQVIGHEIAGVISGVGEGVSGISTGDPVTAVTSVGCGKCRLCAVGRNNICAKTEALGYFYAGGFAEYIKIPAEGVVQNNIIKLHPHLSSPPQGGRIEEGGISFDEGAIVEPLSCCLNAQTFLNIREGDRVVVFGAGPIGLMHIELALAKGAVEIFLIDINQERLRSSSKIARIDHLINSFEKDPVQAIMDLTGSEGADVIITANPAKITHEQALKMAAIRGRISLFGGLPKDDSIINFDSNIVHYREISVFGAFASARPEYEEALDLIASGRVNAKKFITHRLPLERITEGFELVMEGKALKVVINP